jgi:hypothetical protein
MFKKKKDLKWRRKSLRVSLKQLAVTRVINVSILLNKKLEYIKNITGFKEMTVCEDESEAYEYWKNNFNYNPNDCCNLRIA